MANPGPGRPRLAERRRPGTTPRAEILDAAGELFTTDGYANTSTRRIADAVGIRQASLYHHFATKDDILDALLADTVADALALAERLVATGDPADTRLYALARFDVGQLCASRWNLGVLYLLPELRSERFAAFRERRDLLHRHYATIARQVLSDLGDAVGDALAELPFRLVETTISIRSDVGTAPHWAVDAIPVAALRILGWSGDIAAVHGGAAALLD